MVTEMTTKMETEEGNESSFSRVKELRAMFEDSLTMCFEPKTIGVCLILFSRDDGIFKKIRSSVFPA